MLILSILYVTVAISLSSLIVLCMSVLSLLLVQSFFCICNIDLIIEVTLSLLNSKHISLFFLLSLPLNNKGSSNKKKSAINVRIEKSGFKLKNFSRLFPPFVLSFGKIIFFIILNILFLYIITLIYQYFEISLQGYRSIIFIILVGTLSFYMYAVVPIIYNIILSTLIYYKKINIENRWNLFWIPKIAVSLSILYEIDGLWPVIKPYLSYILSLTLRTVFVGILLYLIFTSIPDNTRNNTSLD